MNKPGPGPAFAMVSTTCDKTLCIPLAPINQTNCGARVVERVICTEIESYRNAAYRKTGSTPKLLGNLVLSHTHC